MVEYGNVGPKKVGVIYIFNLVTVSFVYCSTVY